MGSKSLRILNHPGDAYSYDIFTQAGKAVGPREANWESIRWVDWLSVI
ncbi:MAG: hypothetical protein Ct9H300mP8_05680 [Gammaproteobacteria bacterium]|nr:MAG: hypothetical protein Ct9H300mP8_05680 [Gammaproteobacteria bacterium]